MKNIDGILPDFPRTRHLPWKPNALRDDLIASEKEASIIFETDNVFVEEKVDAASVGITVVDGQPTIRNRNHILNKAHDRVRTAAKMQFAPIWSWYYEHQNLFQKLMEHGPATAYGEWMWARHGLEYDKLPSYYIPYDLYDHEKRHWIATDIVRQRLTDAGFATTPLLHRGRVVSYEQLEALVQSASPFTTLALREGVYLKVTDGEKVTHRFKMVRPGFIQGEHWSKTEIVRNRLKK